MVVFPARWPLEIVSDARRHDRLSRLALQRATDMIAKNMASLLQS